MDFKKIDNEIKQFEREKNDSGESMPEKICPICESHYTTKKRDFRYCSPGCTEKAAAMARIAKWCAHDSRNERLRAIRARCNPYIRKDFHKRTLCL